MRFRFMSTPIGKPESLRYDQREIAGTNVGTKAVTNGGARAHGALIRVPPRRDSVYGKVTESVSLVTVRRIYETSARRCAGMRAGTNYLIVTVAAWLRPESSGAYIASSRAPGAWNVPAVVARTR